MSGKKAFVLCGWGWYDHTILVVHVTPINARLYSFRLRGLIFSIAVTQNLGVLALEGETWWGWCDRVILVVHVTQDWAQPRRSSLYSEDLQ